MRTRADLMQQTRISVSDFGRLLGLSRKAISRRASAHPELYAPMYTDEAGRPWFAPWQVALVHAVGAGVMDADEAGRERERRILMMTDVDACETAFRVPAGAM